METITDVLRREHRVVLQTLDRFEKALETGSNETLRDILRFFDERLTLHRRKEEEVLFPELAHQLPPHSGPVPCMLEEHAEEKWRLTVLREALEAGEREEVERHGRAVIALLRNHIWKEENVLFPLADQILAEDSRERVRRGFQEIGCCCPECEHEAPELHPPQGRFRDSDAFDPY